MDKVRARASRLHPVPHARARKPALQHCPLFNVGPHLPSRGYWRAYMRLLRIPCSCSLALHSHLRRVTRAHAGAFPCARSRHNHCRVQEKGNPSTWYDFVLEERDQFWPQSSASFPLSESPTCALTARQQTGIPMLEREEAAGKVMNLLHARYIAFEEHFYGMSGSRARELLTFASLPRLVLASRGF